LWIICIALGKSEGADGDWTKAFRDNNQWQGMYNYDGQSIQFSLAVHSVDENVVKATLQDHITQLELIGKPLCSA